MKATATAAATALTALLTLAGCSAQQGYASAQSLKRNQCSKIVGAQERIRCLREADQPYDSYQNKLKTQSQVADFFGKPDTTTACVVQHRGVGAD